MGAEVVAEGEDTDESVGESCRVELSGYAGGGDAASTVRSGGGMVFSSIIADEKDGIR